MKKSLLVAVSVVLVAALALGGSLAYLMSEDEDVNVMVVGNVKIEQLEYERVTDANGNYVATNVTDEYGYTPDDLQEYTQAKVIIPAVYDEIKWADDQQSWGEVGAPGSNQLFNDNMKNVQDKFVFVKNTGSVDAYYRTIVAVECPVGFDSDLLHLNVSVNSRFTWTDIGFITVDGVQYALKEALYNEILTPGEISRPSLLQVFVGKEATNEDVALLGPTLDILVISQGVQADGFDSADEALDEAFYDVTVANHPWVDNHVAINGVDNSDDFEDAVTADKKIIVVNLSEDVTYDVAAWAKNGMGTENTETIVINGNGNTITFNQTNSDWNNIVTNGAKLVINNANITNAGRNDGPWNRHDLNFACEVELNNVKSDKAIALKAGGTLNNVTIDDANTSDTYALWIQPNGQTVTLKGCTIDMLDCTDGRGIKIDEQYVSAPEKVTLNVSDTTFKTEEKSAILVKSVAGADIVIDNIDISGVAADSTNAVWVDEASVDYADLVVVTGASKIVEP